MMASCFTRKFRPRIPPTATIISSFRKVPFSTMLTYALPYTPADDPLADSTSNIYQPFLMETSYSTRNVIFYKINDRIGLTHDTIEYTHDRTRFTHDTIGLIYDRIG